MPPRRDSRGILYICIVAALAALGAHACAHDIPNAQVDRAIQVTVQRGRLVVDYEVSLAELTLVQDLRSLIGSIPRGDREALFDRYGRETGPLNAKGFLITLDGRPLELRVRSYDVVHEGHPRYTFHFETTLASEGRLSIRDTNYVASEGTSRLAVRTLGEIAVRGYDGPANVSDIAIRPVWQLTDAEERRTKQVDLEIGAATSPANVKQPSISAKVAPARVVQPSQARKSLTGLLGRANRLSMLGLWFVALGLGGAHALQPGHGKTLVAAGTTATRRAWINGVLLALILTVTHASTVLAVAGLVWLTRSTRYDLINEGLARAAGFAIAAVGVWRLGRHFGGYEERPADARPVEFGRQGIIWLGISGGLVPCWDAILLVMEAEFLGQTALGLYLLAAFSLGMALVLVSVAFGSAHVRRFVERRDRIGVWSRRIGILSALALTGIGLYLLFS